MDKERIILIGTGEHAQMLIDNIDQQERYELLGLITNDIEEVGRSVLGYKILCTDDNLHELLNEHKEVKGYFLGIGVKSMKFRRKIYTKIDSILTPVNIIHPTAIISKHARIGKGNLFEAYTKVANNVLLGNHCIVNSFTSVNHDQIIGDNVLLACSVSLAGKSIGSDTIIADGASIGFKRNVGKNCIIGDGAVVTKDIPDDSIAYGNPARVVRVND